MFLVKKFQDYFLFNTRNILISKYNILNIYNIPKINGFFISIDFLNGLAIWKRRFSIIYLLLLFIVFFFLKKFHG